MNIGFDIDGVLTNIEDYQLEKGTKFFKEKYGKEIVNEKGFDVEEIFGATKEETKAFWTKHLIDYSIKEPARDGASEFIKKLHDNGNKITIITSRFYTNDDTKTGKLMRYIVKEWLKHNNIQYDDIVFCSDDKTKAINENRIDVMFEDSPKNIEDLKKLTNVICMDAGYNKDSVSKKISTFDEADSLIEEIKEEKKQYEVRKKDPIKPLFGRASIDKPYLKYYSDKNFRNPNTTMYNYVYSNNKDFLDGIALNYFDNKITYSEFFDKIDKYAKGYTKLGVKKDDIVTICMPNTPEAVISVYALNKLGAIANLIHPLSGENEIRDYLNEVNSKVMMVYDGDYDKVKNIIDQTDLENVVVASPKDSMPIVMNALYTVAVSRKNNFYKDKPKNKYLKMNEFVSDIENVKYEEAPYEKDKLSIIMHTGGTTGTSKGVMHTSETFNNTGLQCEESTELFKRGDSIYTVLPIFHGFGLSSSIHVPLSLGITAILVPQPNVKKLGKEILKYKPNNLAGIPTMWEAVVKQSAFKNKDLSFIKTLSSGGDTIKAEQESEINEFLKEHNSKAKLNNGYGLTETISALSFSHDGCRKSGSVGIPMIGNIVKIVEVEENENGILSGTDKEVKKDGIEGEICVSGPIVMKGYYGKEEETNDVLKVHSDGKLWLHTGDLGYCDDEGVVYYTQRLKRMIVSNGYNLYPAKIEQVLMNHDAVEKSIVVGVNHPYKGEAAKAYIILKGDCKESQEQLRNELNENCLKNLPKYSLPYKYSFVKTEDLPKTKFNKINYIELAKMKDENEISAKVMTKKVR